MFEKNKQAFRGRTTYNTSIVTNIVTLAVSEVDGVATDGSVAYDKTKNPEKYLQKIKLDFDGNEVFIDVSIYVYFGHPVPDLAFKVQEAVKNAVENMTTFKVKSVDVRVLGVIMPKEARDNT